MMSTNIVSAVVVARRNIAKMLIVVVCMFALCYLPVHLINMLRSVIQYTTQYRLKKHTVKL